MNIKFVNKTFRISEALPPTIHNLTTVSDSALNNLSWPTHSLTDWVSVCLSISKPTLCGFTESTDHHQRPVPCEWQAGKQEAAVINTHTRLCPHHPLNKKSNNNKHISNRREFLPSPLRSTPSRSLFQASVDVASNRINSLRLEHEIDTYTFATWPRSHPAHQHQLNHRYHPGHKCVSFTLHSSVRPSIHPSIITAIFHHLFRFP